MTTITVNDQHYRDGDLRLRGKPVFRYRTKYPQRRSLLAAIDDDSRLNRYVIDWLREKERQGVATIAALLHAAESEAARLEQRRKHALLTND